MANCTAQDAQSPGRRPQYRRDYRYGVNLGLGRDRSSSRSVIGFTFKDREVTTDWLHISYDYLKTLNIKLLAGGI